MTVIGLCLGGGQLALGSAATVLAVIPLWALKWVDARIAREQRAVSGIRVDPERRLADKLVALDELISALGYKARFRRQTCDSDAPLLDAHLLAWFDVRWLKREAARPPLDLLEAIENQYAIVSFEMGPDTTH